MLENLLRTVSGASYLQILCVTMILHHVTMDYGGISAVLWSQVIAVVWSRLSCSKRILI
jgi:hypothetical protein